MNYIISITITIMFLFASLSFGNDLETKNDFNETIVDKFRDNVNNLTNLSVNHEQIVNGMKDYFKNYDTKHLDHDIKVSSAISEDKKIGS